MGEYTRIITPRLMDYAQRNDWLGRRIFVLGCGTGTAIEYLTQYPSYNISGIDLAPEMLDIAKRKLSDVSVRWSQQDIRELGPSLGSADLILAVNVINELNSLRDLEAVFMGAARVLESGKLLIFDMQTLQGLTEEGVRGDRMLYNDGRSLTVFSSSEYDYERQMQSLQYFIFQRAGEHWTRNEAKVVLRAFPAQAVASLLVRAGFTMKAIMSPNFEPYEPGTSRGTRIIFVAEKQAS
jgi:SAM-dependent methyltransferase